MLILFYFIFLFFSTMVPYHTGTVVYFNIGEMVILYRYHTLLKLLIEKNSTYGIINTKKKSTDVFQANIKGQTPVWP